MVSQRYKHIYPSPDNTQVNDAQHCLHWNINRGYWLQLLITWQQCVTGECQGSCKPCPTGKTEMVFGHICSLTNHYPGFFLYRWTSLASIRLTKKPLLLVFIMASDEANKILFGKSSDFKTMSVCGRTSRNKSKNKNGDGTGIDLGIFEFCHVKTILNQILSSK